VMLCEEHQEEKRDRMHRHPKAGQSWTPNCRRQRKPLRRSEVIRHAKRLGEPGEPWTARDDRSSTQETLGREPTQGGDRRGEKNEGLCAAYDMPRKKGSPSCEPPRKPLLWGVEYDSRHN